MMPVANAVEPSGRPHEWLSESEAAGLKPSALAGGAILAAHLLFYAATLVGAVADLPLWANLVSAAANGLAIGLLFVIAHDAVHLSLVPGAFWNRVIARVVLTPHLHSASLWELGHNRSHHRKTNYRAIDYVWAPSTLEEYRRMRPFRRFVERVYRGPLGPLFYYQAEIWFKRMLLPLSKDARGEWRRHVLDSVYIFTAGAALIAFIALLGETLAPKRSLIATLALGYLIPFLIWGYLGGVTFYLQHTHPLTPWFNDAKDWTYFRGVIRGTIHARHVIRGAPIYSFVMEHNAHHSLPTIPVYKLPAAQAMVKKAYPGQFVDYEFNWREYAQIISACKLYDFKNRQWTDFSGKPTGPRLFNGANARAANLSAGPDGAHGAQAAEETPAA